MEEFTGILTRKPVILLKVSYGVLQTDDETIPLVAFAVAKQARQSLAQLEQGAYVNVKGTRQINKQSGLEELAVTYIAELNLTDSALDEPEEDALEAALRLIRDTPREVVKAKAAQLQPQQEDTDTITIDTDNFHML